MRILHNSNQLYLQLATFLDISSPLHSIPNIRRKFPGYPENFHSRRLRERRRAGAASFPRLLRSSNLTAHRAHVSSFHWRKNVRGHSPSCAEFFFANQRREGREKRGAVSSRFSYRRVKASDAHSTSAVVK